MKNCIGAEMGHDDQRRRYYRLTALGQRVGAAEQTRLTALLDAAQLRQLGLSGLT